MGDSPETSRKKRNMDGLVWISQKIKRNVFLHLTLYFISMKRSSYIFSIHKNVGLLPYARKHAKILLIPRLWKEPM